MENNYFFHEHSGALKLVQARGLAGDGKAWLRAAVARLET